MLYVLISLFYLLFVVFDVNVKMYEGDSGCYLWCEVVKTGIEVCKFLMKKCKYIKLFILLMIEGKFW